MLNSDIVTSSSACKGHRRSCSAYSVRRPLPLGFLFVSYCDYYIIEFASSNALSNLHRLMSRSTSLSSGLMVKWLRWHKLAWTWMPVWQPRPKWMSRNWNLMIWRCIISTRKRAGKLLIGRNSRGLTCNRNEAYSSVAPRQITMAFWLQIYQTMLS